ncbi:MAG: NUDIX domain-containing protein [Candidatus Levyibacteriota bacterium]
MKFEFSAGGIVYKNQRSKIKNQKDKILILVAQHSQHHGWVFPKGLVGDQIRGEKKEDTAVREVEEETGIKAKIIKAFIPVIYWYVFKGEKIRKTVYYFLMEYISGDIKKHDFEMENVEWLNINKVEKRLTYKSDKQVWQEAKKLILNFKFRLEGSHTCPPMAGWSSARCG